MRVTRVVLVAIFFVIHCEKSNSQFSQGCESCISNTGKTGSCVNIERCPEAVKLIHANGYPKLCGFDSKYPIVCCEEIQCETSTVSGLIARKKCEEYKITSITTTTTTTTTTLAPGFVGIFGIGGVDATPLEFPHMAVLGYGSSDDIQWLCGGSLISENFVLTAAHCLYSRFGKVQYINLGAHQLSVRAKYLQSFKIKNNYVHPDYASSQNYHDIALLELDHPANIQSGVKPACLHTSKELPSRSLVATGWGATELHGGITDTLQKVNLSYVPFNNCVGYYKPQQRLNNGLMDDSQLCADGGQERADTCQGDSGGPLQVKLAGEVLYTVVGITSFGVKCAIVPAVYTRISNYVPWIESIVWPN